MNSLKAAGKGLGLMEIANYGLNAGFMVDSYVDERNNGNGMIGSAANAIIDNALPMVVGAGTYMLGAAAIAAPGLIVSGAEKLNASTRAMEKSGRNTPFGNAQFADSQQAYTMRQAGMALAQQSKYNVQQSLIGNEARHLHR